MSHEGLAASIILDKNDPSLLTWKEIKDSWGSCANFFFSYGLKPWNPSDGEEAVNLSRMFKAEKLEEEKEENQQSSSTANTNKTSKK
jgi:hypothetical protein